MLDDKQKTQIDATREAIQEDLQVILDGLDEKTLDNVCEMVVDRMNNLKNNL